MGFKREVAKAIASGDLLSPGQPVLAAVSGGADSLALAHVLIELGYAVQMAHFDHRLRPDSGADAEFVGGLASAWGVPYHLGRADRGQFDGVGSLEAAARDARYAFLLRIATNEGLTRVAAGHTLDDQAETVLLHFLRGAGANGLGGMRARRPLSSEAGGVALIRPLLAIRRVDTVKYCRDHGLAARQDSSNTDPSFQRNRIRHELLPLLRSYNEGIDGVLARNALVMQALADSVRARAEAAWADIARVAGRELMIDADAFSRQEPAVQRAVLRLALERLDRAGPQPTFDEVERLRHQLAAGTPSRQQLAGGWLSSLRSGTLVIGPGRRAAPPDGPQLEDGGLPLPDQGVVSLGPDWSLEIRRLVRTGDRPMAASAEGESDHDRWCESMDADRLVGRLTLRGRRPGDRMRPLGMRGTMKLSDLFVNEKVPASLRAAWPVLVDEARVCWVPGLRLSHEVRLSPETRRIVVLRMWKG